MCSCGHWLNFVSFVSEKNQLLCPNNWKNGEYHKNAQKTPCLGGNTIFLWVQTTSHCSMAAKRSDRPGQTGEARPSLQWGSTCKLQIPPAKYLLLQGTGCTLRERRLLVDTEQPLSLLPPGKPSMSAFLAFSKPCESRKSHSLTDVSIS